MFLLPVYEMVRVSKEAFRMFSPSQLVCSGRRRGTGCRWLQVASKAREGDICGLEELPPALFHLRQRGLERNLCEQLAASIMPQISSSARHFSRLPSMVLALCNRPKVGYSSFSSHNVSIMTENVDFKYNN